MDLPPYHHHHHRYVQRPPNFFHHLPPPPHPPPPPPPPIPNLPLPPPPYHHVSHQFSFTTHRVPLENPQFFDYRRSPPRVSSNLTLDPPPYHHPYPPNIPYHDHYRTPSPPPSPHHRLVIDDFIENRTCAVNDNKERVWIRRDVEFNVDDDDDDDERYHLARRRMDVRSCAGNYESDNDNYQGQIWDYGNVDDVLVEHRRVAALDNGYDDYSDVRFSNRLREEIHRSPPQKQKKSALLRIQCAKANNNNRSRNQENDSRGKQKDVCERLDRMVEGRQGSPMDLDVSFKSNALVAKAIMTPPRPSVDPERSGTPRPKKIRKVNLSAAPMKKNGDDLGKGESSANDSGHRLSSSKEYKCLVTGSAGGSSSNSTLNSNKESKRLSDKITDSAGGRASDGTLNSDKESELLPDKMTVPIVRSAIVRSEGVRSAVVRTEVVRSVSNNTPLLSSHGMNDLFGTGESKGSPEVVVLDQGSSQVGKDGTPLRKFRKKKKNAKKEKKVTTPIRVGVDPGNAIDAQKKVTLFCQQDEDVVDLVEKTTSDQVTIVEDANMTMPSDELVSEIGKPSKMTVVGEDESIKQSNSDGKKASSASVLVSSSNLDSGINDAADCTSRSLPSSPSMLNSTFMIGVQNTRTGFAPDNVGGHSQDGLRVSEDGLAKESSDTMVCVEGNDDVVLSSHDGSTIPTSLAAENAGGHSQDELRVSGDGLIKESSEAMIFVEGNSSVVLSSLDGSNIPSSFGADNVGGHAQDELRVSEDGIKVPSAVEGNSDFVLSSLDGSKIPTSFGADNVGGHSQDELRVSEDGIKVPSEVERNSDIVLSSLDGSKIPTSFCADNVAGYSQDEFRVTEDGLNKEPSEAMVCVEGNDNVVLSSEGGSKILQSEVSSMATDTYISSVSDLEFSDGKKNAVAIIGSLEAGSMETSSHPKIVPVPAYIEKGLQESFLDGNDSFNSHEAGRIAVVDDLLSAECLSNSGPGAGTFVGSMDRSCVDWVIVSPEISQTKGSGNEMVSVVDDITINVDDDCLSKFASERKYSDTHSALTTTRTSHTKGNACSSLLVQGNCLREEQSSREEEVTVAGEGNDSPKGDHSHGDCLNDIPSSCCAKSPKKRNVSSPRLVNTVSCVTTHEGPSSMPVTVPLTNNAYVTELESQNAFSNADTGPPSHPSVILHESNTAKDGCQAAPIEDDSMDHFSDIQQIIACSQLGAAGKETTTSDVSVGSLGMAYAVSEEKGSSLGIDQKMAQEDRKCHNHVLEKEDIPLLANSLSLFADSNGVSAMKASGKGVEMVPNVSPPAAISSDLPINSTSVELTHSSTSNEIVIKDPNIAENSITANDPVSCSVKISSDTSEFRRSPDHEVGGIHLVNVNTASQVTVESTQNVSSLSWKPNFYANQQSPACPRGFSGRPSPSFIAPRNVPISKKPLTWCRTGNSSSSDLGRGSQKNFLPPQSHLPKVTGKVSSYFRKGNSLVRNPSPVGSLFQAYHAPSSSVYRLNSSGVNDLKRKAENRTDVTDSPSCKRTPEVNAPSIAFSCSSERPKTPPQSEPFSCITTKSTSLPVVDHPGNGSIATNSDILEVTEKTLKPSEHASTSSALPECGLRGNSESQNTVDEGSSGKKIVYVKQKSNQLVAASDKSQTSSHGYYKRRKNQLIRASSTNHMKQRVGAAENIVPIRSGMKRLSGLARTSKWSKSSLVWKLGDAQSSRKCGSTVGYEKLWPCLFPWKRASYRRSFLSSSPNDSSTSIIRRKLLLAKKRETIYTRSIYGLSLRRSKVLSVSGSSLKWSKSIEQRSKKAIEEAARPVAAVAKRKRAQDGSNADLVNENNVSRERIFRIGCERYKMDPSGKTLQRISDEEPSVSVVPEVKKSYIPKRLLIGNDEYVRVGNGNKLVRNPKRRVRLLANEKVRWSLHTARIRLAKKKQYCQFFTRFGKCNKDNGKCPYIHEPSKIAVCTKFLNGSCSDSNCKLTHEVIPERMQDCSYFLQGICSNENCPYRHVNVNPNASVCEGFLRGYCADGNECRKKHTYVCPVFEATGSCSQGSKCKLHHPKNKRKGVKRKASSEMKNVRGRYFGSPRIDISERITAGSEKPSVNGSADIFFKEGKFVDFISLDDEEGQTIDQRSEETPICESGSAEMRLDDLDELIKPVCLLNRNRSVNSSPFIGSPSDMTASYVSEESLL